LKLFLPCRDHRPQRVFTPRYRDPALRRLRGDCLLAPGPGVLAAGLIGNKR